MPGQKRCSTCAKRVNKTKCAVLKVMIGLTKDCFAWDGDPEWYVKLFQATLEYIKGGRT